MAPSIPNTVSDMDRPTAPERRDESGRLTCAEGAHVDGLSHLSLVALVRRIVVNGDRQALEHLHNHRTVFRLRSGPPMLLGEFLATLLETRWANRLADGDEVILDGAYDITVDKFTHLPTCEGPTKSPGPDCRHYYKDFLRRVSTLMDDRTQPVDALVLEQQAAGILQRVVMLHFRLACLEARRRRSRARTRYAWRTDGQVLYLWMPQALLGSRRRAWLEENAGPVDHMRPGERERVQAIIDGHWGKASHVPVDGWDSAPRGQMTPEEVLIQAEVGVMGLARAVAAEKADRIDEQRPAIAAMGRGGLKRLILRIFADLADGRYEEKNLAEVFGLSRPTFSRFAGSRWRESSGRVPDLWGNVAQVLAGHRDFVQAARDAGVWPSVAQVLADLDRRRGGGHGNA